MKVVVVHLVSEGGAVHGSSGAEESLTRRGKGKEKEKNAARSQVCTYLCKKKKMVSVESSSSYAGDRKTRGCIGKHREEKIKGGRRTSGSTEDCAREGMGGMAPRAGSGTAAIQARAYVIEKGGPAESVAIEGGMLSVGKPTEIYTAGGDTRPSLIREGRCELVLNNRRMEIIQ